jgi:hypothetical protein
MIESMTKRRKKKGLRRETSHIRRVKISLQHKLRRISRSMQNSENLN